MNKQINPTRMELMKLKKKLETTKRGHKLLKDKQDEFIHLFIETIKSYKNLREEVEQKIEKVLYYYKLAVLDSTSDVINNQIAQSKERIQVNSGTEKVMGIDFPVFEISTEKSEYTYDYCETRASFDLLIEDLNTLFSQLIRLIEMETKVEIMIVEIEKSKRRVNAIDSIIIKEINDSIREIKMKLSDLERSNTIRMIKSKDIILNKKK